MDRPDCRLPNRATPRMATASTSGQSSFGLGRKKKSPGLLDQIGRFFGGDKKRKGKVNHFFFLKCVFQTLAWSMKTSCSKFLGEKLEYS